MRGRMIYLGEDLLLLLLLPTDPHAGTSPYVGWKVIGRPHLRGSPRRLGHSVGLSLPLRLLCLWLPLLLLIGWNSQDLTLPSGGMTPHQLVLLGDSPNPLLGVAQDRLP